MKLFLFLAFVLALVAAYELVVAWAFRVVGEPDPLDAPFEWPAA